MTGPQDRGRSGVHPDVAGLPMAFEFPMFSQLATQTKGLDARPNCKLKTWPFSN